MISSPIDANGSFNSMSEPASPRHSKRFTPDSNDNFWEIGKYKRVTQRLTDGSGLCDSFAMMVKERASIEAKYAAQLRSFSKKWGKQIERGNEDPIGTVRAAWRALLIEADEQAEVHSQVYSGLNDTVQSDIQGWKKEHFAKTLMGHFKVTQAATDGFEQAQKPWAKLKDKVSRSKKAYHRACREYYSLESKVREAETSGTLSHEDLIKLREKLASAKDSMQGAREKYEGRVRLLNEDVSRYRQTMTDQFQSCQDSEQRRMDFFKRTMAVYAEMLAIDSNPCHERVAGVIDAVSSDADLLRYAQMSGVGMPLSVPQFTEYNEEEDPDIIATDYLAVPGAGNGAAAAGGRPGLTISHHVGSVQSALGGETDADADSDEDWDEVAERLPPPPDNPNQGIPVRALYDYTAEEPEEISFKAGDLLVQLEDEDEQGWCQGQNSEGHIGLYPANYVEPVAASNI